MKRFINASSSSVFGVKDESDIKEFLEPEQSLTIQNTKRLPSGSLKAAAVDDFITTVFVQQPSVVTLLVNVLI